MTDESPDVDELVAAAESSYDASRDVAAVLMEHGLKNSEVFAAFARILAQMTVKEALRDREPLGDTLIEIMQAVIEHAVPMMNHYATCQCRSCVEYRDEATASGGPLN